MKKVNLNEIKEEPWQSPGGKYAVSFKGISEALGREPASLDLSKRHPFDLELNRVPPGKMQFPLPRALSAMGACIWLISGKGTVRHKDGKTEVVPGDAFIFGPDEPHQLINSATKISFSMSSRIIRSANQRYYPDSGKWKVNKSSAADRVVIKGNETDYFDGEE